MDLYVELFQQKVGTRTMVVKCVIALGHIKTSSIGN